MGFEQTTFIYCRKHEVKKMDTSKNPIFGEMKIIGRDIFVELHLSI